MGTYTTVFIKFVVSLMILNDHASLTIVNDDPSLTIFNIIVNKFYFSKAIVIFRIIVKKRSQIVIIKTIVFKDDRYSFFKSSKRLKNETKNDRLTIFFKND